MNYHEGMAIPQPGIFALGGRSHLHLEFDLTGDAVDLRPAISRIYESADTVSGVNLVVGFGRTAWAALSPDNVPDDLIEFETITGVDGFEHPAAQHDLWIWLHGGTPDGLFDLARVTQRELVGVATLASEQNCFTYQASRDLTGFEDGTENPPLSEAPAIASIPEDRACAAGSIVLLQRWRHDLDKFESLSVAEQEQVFGRTKVDSVELGDEETVPGSHIQRVVIEDEAGEELEVFRRSTAFGGLREHGLMFLAFSSDRARLQEMLDRLAGVGDGIRDLITTVSTPTASAWYIAPPVELL